MAKKTSPANAALELYKKAVIAAGIELKGATLPYTSLNGHMFSVFQKDNTLNLRLAAEDIEGFRKKHKTDHPVQYGVTLINFVVVPEKVLKNTTMMKKYLKQSEKYVKGLKPKKGK
jgi:hypothetical protein